ncbi:hypothetical protein I5Q45_04270 [Serratia marcescens]|nr:hypothetical protein [Serratia marcescens]
MTPQQAIKYIILDDIFYSAGEILAPDMTGDMVDAAYDAAVEEDRHYDAEYQTREGQVETGLDCPLSRHYEAKAVAAKAPNGLWIGWTYWFGGGKHSEPEAIPWMQHAYFLECAEEEKVVTVRTFTKVAGDADDA